MAGNVASLHPTPYSDNSTEVAYVAIPATYAGADSDHPGGQSGRLHQCAAGTALRAGRAAGRRPAGAFAAGLLASAHLQPGGPCRRHSLRDGGAGGAAADVHRRPGPSPVRSGQVAQGLRPGGHAGRGHAGAAGAGDRSAVRHGASAVDLPGADPGRHQREHLRADADRAGQAAQPGGDQPAWRGGVR